MHLQFLEKFEKLIKICIYLLSFWMWINAYTTLLDHCVDETVKLDGMHQYTQWVNLPLLGIISTCNVAWTRCRARWLAGAFSAARFLPLHQPPGDDLTWPLSPTNPFWWGESAVAPAACTSWPRLAPPSSERSWRPLTLDGAGWNILYLISCELRLIHSRSINI